MSTRATRRERTVYDPRGVVEAEPRSIAPRLEDGSAIRLGVLDNTKWNARKLLQATVAELESGGAIGEVRYYKKETFSKNAAPDLIRQIAQENDGALTAVGD